MSITYNTKRKLTFRGKSYKLRNIGGGCDVCALKSPCLKNDKDFVSEIVEKNKLLCLSDDIARSEAYISI